MKKLLLILSCTFISVLLSNCTVPTVKEYQPPIYKTINKSITIEETIDSRTNEKHKEDFLSTRSINQLIVNRYMQTQIFQRVNSALKSTYSDDFTLTTKLVDYGMDKNMTFWTVFPDALLLASGVVIDQIVESNMVLPVFAILAGADFVINGLAGKREYNHDYITSIYYEFKDKSMKALWSDTLSYNISYRFTHWSINWGTDIASKFIRANDVDYINSVALNLLVDLTIEDSFKKIAQVIGSDLAIENFNEDNAYSKNIKCKEGLLTITIQRIN
jgi:hypothetical protein